MPLKTNMNQPRDESPWSGIALQVLMNTVSYPAEYAKVLIQIGFEPIPPRQTTTIFRQPALALPNVFQYVRYIQKVDGFYGCYRGLVPKLCVYAVSAIAVDKANKYIDEHHAKKSKENEDEYAQEEEGESWDKFIFKMIRDTISQVIGIIVSHPFEVVSLRMVAQFVGKERKYKGIISSFVRIYSENGIMGYYAGLTPRLIGNVSLIILASSSTYIINKYLISDRDLKAYTASTMKFIAATVTYPFLVVSHCMAVNNCGLAAGLPPNMPIYNNWKDCWSHLSSMKQLKRGSTLLWRYYTGPKVMINGKLVPITGKDYPEEKTK